MKKGIKNIFFLFFLIIPIISYDHWTQVTDETFNWETNYNNVKWLLFFTHSNCKKCIPIYDLLNNFMYNFYSNYTEKNIMNFIDKKKPVSSALPIPKGAKLKYIYKTYGTLLSHKINFSMQYYLDKFNIPIRWNKYFTIFFAFIFLILLIIFFIFIIVFCCRLFTAICCCGLCLRKKRAKDIEIKIKEKIE